MSNGQNWLPGAEQPGEPQQEKNPFFLLAFITVVTMVISRIPIVSYVLFPLDFFTTALHELGHAVACVATGGDVNGLTIVSDGKGHGGLTFCTGGWRFIVAQAGYLGTTIFGCLLIYLTSFKNSARSILNGLAVLVTLTVLFFMSSTLTMDGYFLQGLMSMGVGIAGAVIMFWVAAKASFPVVRILVLFLAVHTTLNALSDLSLLAMLSLGLLSGGTSDATNMASMTGIPAIIWSVLWGGISIGLLWMTVKRVYARS